MIRNFLLTGGFLFPIVRAAKFTSGAIYDLKSYPLRNATCNINDRCSRERGRRSRSLSSVAPDVKTRTPKYMNWR